MRKLIYTFLIVMGIILPLMSIAQLGDLPSITFLQNSATLSMEAKNILSTIAAKLKENAKSSIEVIAYPAATKAGQAEANKRLMTVQSYLLEKEGISADRISVSSEMGNGESNTVDFRDTDIPHKMTMVHIITKDMLGKTPPVQKNPLPASMPVKKAKPVKKTRHH